jgi:hypothetical protein
LLAAVVTVNEQTLQAELGKLVSAGILYVKGQPPASTYLFKHALLEEALHGAIDEPTAISSAGRRGDGSAVYALGGDAAGTARGAFHRSRDHREGDRV